MGKVVVPFDVIEIHRPGDAWLLVEIEQIALQVGIIDNAAHGAFEMAVIDRIETNQRAKEPPVGLHDAVAEEVALLGEARLEFVQRGEEFASGRFITFLRGGKAGFVDANCLPCRKNERGKVSAWFRFNVSLGKEIDLSVAQRGEGVVEHAADIVLGIIDDPVRAFVPEHRHGDAEALKIRLTRRVGLCSEKEKPLIGSVE